MAPKYINTEAVVIKRSNYKDADKLVTLYTRSNGKIVALAKGVRRINAKNRSNLELFNHIKVYLVEGKYWYIITQTDLLNPNSNVKSNLESTQNAFFISEILDKILPEGETSDDLFDFILKTFQYLEYIETLNYINAFCIKLLKLTGFYNQNITDLKDGDIKNYLNLLLNSTYEKILNQKSPKEVQEASYRYLKMLIEEIIEKNLKTGLIQ